MNKNESKYFQTAQKFDRALLALLEQKPFEYITVSELCAAAGVNRSTFYLHYENTCDLLEETIHSLLEHFADYFSVDANKLAHHFADCTLEELNFISEEYLEPYLSCIRNNQRAFQAVISQPQIFRLSAMYQQMFHRLFSPILARYHYPEEQRQYIMRFYLSGLTSVIQQWVQGGCQESNAEVCAIIRTCIFGKTV